MQSFGKLPLGKKTNPAECRVCLGQHWSDRDRLLSIAPRFRVFPSTEAALPEARSGLFAGCISATANLNADLCARGYHAGDAGALAEAVAIRKLFDGKPLVPGVKALLAHIHGDPQWARVEPPLADFPTAHRAAVIAGYEAVRAKRVA